jgi:hypothetical protein
MPSSRIVTIAESRVIDGVGNGAVLLGVVDGLAYVHLAPRAEARRFVNGRIENGAFVYDAELAADAVVPADAVLTVAEPAPVGDWVADAVPYYDPSPVPFKWAVFAEAEPELAEQLMPHQWAGE